jgi:DNA-binding SARP family transcriptional activator
MARPFRFQPPELADSVAIRAGVQATLAGRFDRRVTVVRAGAGFGKTTALAQAFEQNRLNPLGADIWLGCEPGDADAAQFAGALSSAFDLDETRLPADVVGAVVEAIGSRSPAAVALVLDDVHHLVPQEGDGASGIVDDLIDRLPTNGHVVLAGRTTPPVALTRLELTGQCVTIGEADLALDDEQVAALLGAAPDGGVEFGGWPALVQLARSGRARRFVDEEVLRWLDDDELAVVRTLVELGECDTSTLDRLTGGDTERLLDALPMVARRNERWEAHDLWSELLGRQPDDTVVELRCRAAVLALDDRAGSKAVEVLLPVADRCGDVLDSALRTALLASDHLDPSTLRRWNQALGGSNGDAVDPAAGPGEAPDARDVPAGADGLDGGARHPARELLAGLVARLDNPGGEECQRLLRSSAERFDALGDAPASVAALSSLAYAYHARRDVEGLIWAFGRLGALAADGVADALPYPLLAGAMVATSASDPVEVLKHTERLVAMSLPREIRAISLWFHANALQNLGRDSVASAEECYEIGLPLPGMAMIHTGARWRAGMVRDLIEHPTQPLDGERDRFLSATWLTPLYATLGELDEARKHLAIVETSAGDISQWQTTGSVAIPKATLAYAEGRLDDARAIAREFLDVTPERGQGHFYRQFAIGLLYPLVPETRAWFDACASDDPERFGPFYRRDHDLVRALVAVDEDGDPEPVRALEFPSTAGEMMPSLGLLNGSTLLACAVGVGRTDLDDLVDDFVDLHGVRARERWHTLVEHPTAEVAAGARQLVESIPVRPAEQRRLAVLGDTRLSIGGVSVDSADWRRERVRALLTYLVLHPNCTREQAMAALWPDSADVSARRNLRSTLNVLQAVLEPERAGGDAPFFVRSSGQRLRLVLADTRADGATDGLLVDVDDFEAQLDEATRLERSGVSSMSIAHYARAVDAYQGDLLPECFDDWAVFERDRLRSRAVSAGVRLAELLIATGDPDGAVDAASRTLVIEPWSEPAHRALIAAHLERGDVAAARRALDTCSATLADFGGPSEAATMELTRRLARR